MLQYRHYMKFKSWLISLVMLAVLTVTATGLFPFFHDMDQDRQVTGCPLMMDENVICSMSAQEHLSAWQNMFVAIPTEILLLLLLIFVTGPILQYLVYKPPKSLLFHLKERFLTIFDPLQEAFSSGLIHSKAY